MRASNGTVTSYTPRTAAQVVHDTGATAQALVLHAVTVGTQRYGANDARSMAHTYDIAYDVVDRALYMLQRKGLVRSAVDPEFGGIVWSVPTL